MFEAERLVPQKSLERPHEERPLGLCSVGRFFREPVSASRRGRDRLCCTRLSPPSGHPSAP